METIDIFENVRFGILLIAVVLLIVKLVFRSAAATSDEADDPDTANVPAKSVAKPDAQAGEKPRSVSPADDKVRARMAMQKHVSARKAELQAKRANREAAQMIPSLEGPSLEGQSLEGTSLESLSLDGSTKRRQQAPVQQPERTGESSGPDRNDWMEGFDIRRAVVWSEILRPKFKEDEGADGVGIPY